MAKDDLVSVDGKVVDIDGGGSYTVMLENGVSVAAKLCGQMKKYKFRDYASSFAQLCPCA